jgi:transcription antitermination factor NusG
VNTPKRWYVVHVLPNCEFDLEDKLKELGQDVYVPRSAKNTWLRKVKRIIKVNKPLFPNYLFLAANHPMPWEDIRRAVGFNYVVSFDGAPVLVLDEELALIRQREDDGEFDETLKDTRPVFKAGQRVQVVKGVLKDMTVQIISIRIKGTSGLAEVKLYKGTRTLQIPLSCLKDIS